MAGKVSFTYEKDKKILIYERKNIPLKGGFFSEEYTPVINNKLWACYRHLSGQEKYAARSAGYDESCIFTINWFPNIKPGQHVLFRDKVYEITRIDDFEGYKKEIKLYCKWLENSKSTEYPSI